MNQVGIRGVVLGLMLAFTRLGVAQQPEVFTLSLVPVGGTTVDAGTIVAVEVLLTITADACAHTPCTVAADCTAAGFPAGTSCVDGDPGPAVVRTCGGDPVNGIRFEGNQVDVPCVLPGGTSGFINIVPELAGGTTDPDDDGLRGPSSGGATFIFGPGGLGPFAPATCIIATTPAPGALPVNVAVGATRYIGTFFYEVGECAAGSFPIFFECTDQGGPLTTCEDDPEVSNTTRFRNDCPVSTSPGALMRFNKVGTTLTVRTGRCCRGSVCLGDIAEACCLGQGGTWDEQSNCAAGCNSCTSTADCDDRNPCTVDSCSEGACVYTPSPAGGACDDGQFCTIDDACAKGLCQGRPGTCTSPQQPVCDEVGDACVECLTHEDCDDANPCTMDRCATTSHVCTYTSIAAPCDDGLFCTLTDACSAGTCLGGEDRCPGQVCVESLDLCLDCLVDADCGDENPCTDEACVENHCQVTNNTNACDDGLFCTTGDSCVIGSCVGSGEACADPLLCDEALDRCVACLTVADCDDNNPCTDDACDAAGQCQRTNNTNLCDDGLFCTRNDRCADGQCVGGLARGCPSGQVCCEEADACRQCCTAANCEDQNVCTADLCSEGGTCLNTPVSGPCDDGLFCTVFDACLAGICQAVSRECAPKHGCDEDEDRCVCLSNAACDDDNDCTADECVNGDCLNVIDPEATSCDDGLFCTVGDSCANGQCLSQPRICPAPQVCNEDTDRCSGCARHQDCDDGNVCTTDRCSKSTGQCIHINNSKPCNDGLFCTKPDVCSEGVCVGTPRRCPIGLTCDENIDRCVP